MKKKHNLFVFVIIIALLAGLSYMQSSSRVEVTEPSLVEAIKVTVAGVELAYPVTYGVYEKRNSPLTKTLTTVVWYEDTEANKSFFTGNANTSSLPPVTMSLDVYSNPNELSAKQLLGTDAAYMFTQGEGSPVSVAGIQGTLIGWDGLYKGRSLIVQNNGMLYVFSVTSVTSEDVILRDFELLIGSVVFK